MTETLHTPDGHEPPRDARLTRRGLGVGLGVLAAGAGYAAAAGPVNARDVITTSAEGLVVGDVEIAAEDGVMLPAYKARPDGAGVFPAVIVAPEIFGIHEYIRDVCRRLAKAGYVAIAPAFFHRAGDPSQFTIEEINEVFAIVNATPHAQVMTDCDAVVRHLEDDPAADVARLAITGFCWGGRVTWTYAARNPAVKAGAAWYGRLRDPEGPENPEIYPLDVAEQMTGRVLGLYGGRDRGIPVDDVQAMRDALRAAGDEASDIILYEDAEHGFHADYRPSFNAAAAEDGWAKMLAWFDEKGAA